MDVVVHQYVGMQCAARLRQHPVEQLHVVVAIGIVEEAGQAVVAALDHMLGNIGQVEAGLSGHEPSIAADGAVRQRPRPRSAARIRRVCI